MFDRIDPKLLPFIDSESRQLLQSGALSVEDHQALLAEAKKRHDFIEASIPKPTRDDLIRRVHGEYQDMLRAGKLEFGLTQTLLDDAERGWYEGHRAEAIRRAKQSDWGDLLREPPHAPEAKDSSSSTRKELDSFWKPIDAINQAPRDTPAEQPESEPQKSKGLDVSELQKAFEDKPNTEQEAETSERLAKFFLEQIETDRKRTEEASKKFLESIKETEEQFRKKATESIVRSAPEPMELFSWNEFAAREEERRKAEAEAQNQALQKAIVKGFRQVEKTRSEQAPNPSEKFWPEVWAEIKKHPGRYLLGFLLGGVPLGIGTIWGSLTHETIPEWLTAHGWPQLSTLILGWVAVAAIVAIVIVVRSYQSVRLKRRLASQDTTVSFELTRLTYEPYNDGVQYMLARFKYQTGMGYSPKIEVKANITVFNDSSQELPEFAGMWHCSVVRSKGFRDGDSANLVLGLVTDQGMIGYEYGIVKTVNGTEPSPKLSKLLKGNRFYIQAVFVGRTDDETKLLDKTQWFQVDAGPKPHFVGIPKPPFLW